MEQEALCAGNEVTDDDVEHDVDPVLLLDDSSTYIPLKHIDNPDAV